MTKTMEEESKNQRIRIAARLINQEINVRLNQTVEHMMETDPDLLSEAENYQPMDEDGKPDESGEYPEIFEFWAVSEWLGEKLIASGEVVFNMLDFTVWGRTCSGQSIALDSVIQKIAIDAGFHD